MKSKTLEIKVSLEHDGLRLDKLIPLVFSDLTRAKAQTLIENGQVSIDKIVVDKASYKVKNGQIININIVETTSKELAAKAIELDIVYEDSDIVVINKPIDLVVHPAAGHHEDTLVNALVYHFKELSTINGDFRPGIVHRIDKDTSGLLVIAKNDATHQVLAKDIKEKITDRRYYALVVGEVQDQNFIVDAPIGRSRKNRKKMAVVAEGKPAKTEFKIVKRFSGFTLLDAKLYTGRTHQIRVHLAHINYPIVGDQLYGKKSKIKATHQLLHAYYLELIHPKTKKKLIFKADLPQDFKQIVETLQRP